MGPKKRPGCLLRLLELPDETLQRLLDSLPAAVIARAAAACRGLLCEGPRLNGFLRSRGLPPGAPLRAAHLQEARPLAFWWHDGGRTFSGEDGWGTGFGNVRIGRHRVGDPINGRYSWELELEKYDGLLGVGVADGRMEDNAFLSAESEGRWAAWGWELSPQGFVEAIVADGNGDCVQRAWAFSPAMLRPAVGRRVVLILHLDCGKSLLELHTRLQEQPAGPWAWHFLGAIRFARPAHWEEPTELAVRRDLRPAVSTNIGTVVHILDPGDF